VNVGFPSSDLGRALAEMSAAEHDRQVAEVHRKMPKTHELFCERGLLGFPEACPLCRGDQT
jgi:hypothetical protein